MTELLIACIVLAIDLWVSYIRCENEKKEIIKKIKEKERKLNSEKEENK